MEMSYKRAWDLVEEMNPMFGKPLVAAQTGGKHGGGAQLTPVGLAVVSRFRAIERAAASAAEQHMAALQAEIAAGLSTPAINSLLSPSIGCNNGAPCGVFLCRTTIAVRSIGRFADDDASTDIGRRCLPCGHWLRQRGCRVAVSHTPLRPTT